MKKTFTKLLVAFISILVMANMAFAGEACQSKAAAKKLAGKAETSFMKKCEADTKTANTQAGNELNANEKNMAGLAKNSLLKLFFSQHKI